MTTGPAYARVQAALARIAALTGTPEDRPEAWITLRDSESLLAEARAVDQRLGQGQHLPLAGAVVAVKGNIDVAGIPTSCGSRARTAAPETSATAVARLTDAGAVVLGTTNMDQFATGVVGTRSPYGPVRSVADPARISGGSSSGSAIVVALGIVDAAVSTDTAGSGRVPAAFNGIVGLKPTRGLLPLTGVVPAAPSFDVVGVFAADIASAQRFAAVMCGPDDLDPQSRSWPADAPAGAPATPRIGVPDPASLPGLAPAHRRAFDRAVAAAADRGAAVVTVDVLPLLVVGAALYGSGIVAERAAAFGAEFAAIDDPDPSVAEVVERGRAVTAADYLRDLWAMRRDARAACQIFDSIDALLLPTVGEHPTIAEALADPIEVNARVGRYTTFANLADLSAIAVPAGHCDDGSPFGVTVLGPAFHDASVAAIARHLFADGEPEPSWAPATVDVVVFGAHRRGQPLNAQIAGRGGHFVEMAHTAPDYSMYALDTDPPKPAVVRGGVGSIVGERWRMRPEALAALAGDLTAPMTLGKVRLKDGSEVLGYLAEPAAIAGGVDITSDCDWLVFLDRIASPTER